MIDQCRQQLTDHLLLHSPFLSPSITFSSLPSLPQLHAINLLTSPLPLSSPFYSSSLLHHLFLCSLPPFSPLPCVALSRLGLWCCGISSSLGIILFISIMFHSSVLTSFVPFTFYFISLSPFSFRFSFLIVLSIVLSLPLRPVIHLFFNVSRLFQSFLSYFSSILVSVIPSLFWSHLPSSALLLLSSPTTFQTLISFFIINLFWFCFLTLHI